MTKEYTPQEIKNAIFVSSPIEVLHGQEAVAAIEQVNDAAYWTEGAGVQTVPPERWQAAQKYERETWMQYNTGATQDRNVDHMHGFSQYASLPVNLGKVIELGAGVFTNLAYILSRAGSTCDELTILDPLAEVYLKHEHCAYAPGGTLYERQPIVIHQPIEAFKTKKRYDTVIMVNTLDHCYDSGKVFSWIDEHLKAGGWLVFGEAARYVSPWLHMDIGHPLALHQDIIEEFLRGYQQHYRSGAYFIGTKI